MRLSREEDLRLRIASHLLVATLLGEKSGLGYRELLFKKGPYGKPELDLEGAPFFNHSRSGRLAVCALAEHPIGIDVERCDPIDAQTIRLLLGMPEETASNGQTRQEELRFFYARWTMFESWLKAEGTGLHEKYPLSAFVPEPEGVYFRANALDECSPPWVIEPTEIGWPEPTRYRLALCRKPQESPASQVELLDGDELVRRFLMLL